MSGAGEIVAAPGVVIREEELVERFVRAQGPGGQHVNKTSTAVELRFDVSASPGLAEDVKARLSRLAGSRLTQDGVIVLVAQTHASLKLNREAARARLLEMIAAAAVRPKRRRPTKPTFASKLKRLEGKAKRSGLKAARGRVRED
jgi:ribosome-associated protein